MSAPSPDGSISLPMYYAMLTLAASATFQAAVGASDAAGALTHIFPGEMDDHAETDKRPRALIDVDGEQTSTRQGTGPEWTDKGELVLDIELLTDPTYAGADIDNLRAARLSFYNTIGKIKDEMQARSGTPGYLNIISITRGPIGRGDDKENDDDPGESYWGCTLTLDWFG